MLLRVSQLGHRTALIQDVGGVGRVEQPFAVEILCYFQRPRRQAARCFQRLTFGIIGHNDWIEAGDVTCQLGLLNERRIPREEGRNLD